MMTFDVILKKLDAEHLNDVALTAFDVVTEPIIRADLENLPLLLCRGTDARSACRVQNALHAIPGTQVEVYEHSSLEFVQKRRRVHIDLLNLELRYRVVDDTSAFIETQADLVSPFVAKQVLGLMPKTDAEKMRAKVVNAVPPSYDPDPPPHDDVFELLFRVLQFAEDYPKYQMLMGEFIKNVLTISAHSKKVI